MCTNGVLLEVGFVPGLAVEGVGKVDHFVNFGAFLLVGGLVADEGGVPLRQFGFDPPPAAVLQHLLELVEGLSRLALVLVLDELDQHLIVALLAPKGQGGFGYIGLLPLENLTEVDALGLGPLVGGVVLESVKTDHELLPREMERREDPAHGLGLVVRGVLGLDAPAVAGQLGDRLFGVFHCDYSQEINL